MPERLQVLKSIHIYNNSKDTSGKSIAMGIDVSYHNGISTGIK